MLFFGKLPGHGDFVRFNAAGPEIKGFDQWLQEAIFKASRHFAGDWPRVYRDSPAYDFVFHTDGSEAGLAGVLMPSHDLSGRQFPFIVAALIGKRTIARMKSLLPLFLSEFFRETRTGTEQAAAGLPLSELIARMNSLHSLLVPRIESATDEYNEFARSTTWEGFCGRLFGNFDNPRKYLLAHNLIESLRPSPFVSSSPNVGLRFPLTSNAASREREVSFWNHLALTLLGGHSVLPSMFWEDPRGAASGYHFLMLGRPAVRHFLSLVQPKRENDGICRLDEEESVNGGHEIPRLPQRIRIALETRDITLQEFLQVFKDLY